jgi:rod shape-determining protein MreD
MPEHSYTSRRELEQYHFHPLVTVLAPLVCVLLGAMLPRLWPRLDILDLPLIITVFFAVSRRSPIAGTLTGTAIGLLQDAFTSLPFGVNGIAKAIIGYLGASLGFALDVENILNRILINFVASLLQSVVLYGITRRLLGDTTVMLQPVHELIRAGVNTAVAVPLFLLLDRFKVLDY